MEALQRQRIHLVVIPCRPSPHDLRSVGVVVEMCQKAQKPHVFVLNAATARSRLASEAVEVLSTTASVLKTIIHQLTPEAQAPTDPYDPARRDKWVYSAEEIRVIMPGLDLPPVEEDMTDTLYDTDFYAWAQAQAAALQAKNWAALDLDNLVEEVESLARSEYRSLRSEAQRLLVHALKWRYHSDHCGESWRHSIEQARDEIEEVLRENPSLQPRLAEAFTAGYRLARRQASRETHLPLATFPEACPWAVGDILTEEWLPPEATSR
jgi:Domain of unknown function DUF29